MRIIWFQIFFLVFSALAMANVWKRARLWILFWLAADAAVLWPGGATIIANQFGIGRGSDFILYISIAAIFFILFKLHLKVERIGREVTKVVRRDALERDNLKT